MEPKLTLRLSQSQQLVMTPQLQQAIKLLQLSRLELIDMVREEMMENPILEDAAEPLVARFLEVGEEDDVVDVVEGVEVAPADLDLLLVHHGASAPEAGGRVLRRLGLRERGVRESLDQERGLAR